jgi:alkylation response protein AidB-like acyl-CoA dehydrogenase
LYYEGYGCAGGTQKLFVVVAMQLARVDASFCTFFGVHTGLATGWPALVYRLQSASPH